MNKRLIIIIQACIIFSLTAALAVVCMVTVIGEKNEADTICNYETETEQPCVESNKSLDVIENIRNKYTYDITYHALEKVAYLSDYDGNLGGVKYYRTAAVCISIPEDKEKEKRLNRMIVERCIEVLPPTTEVDWWESAMPHITYRSERYLCFHYMPVAYIPVDGNRGKLYFTLDMEEEKWIECPSVDDSLYDEYGEAYCTKQFGNLHEEMEAGWEKPVEEQGDLQGETDYEVYEKTEECGEITFSYTAIRGMQDMEKQERINQLLREPIRTFLSYENWEDEEKKRIFNDVKIFVAYKSDRWLSVVYSLRTAINPDIRKHDGMADLGITINMQTGTRVMLDDLFEIEKMYNWMSVTGIDLKRGYDDFLESISLTEKELLDWYNEENNEQLDGFEAVDKYNHGDWRSFYLYEGKLVILGGNYAANWEIPLPEVYEYLKVDPWYD